MKGVVFVALFIATIVATRVRLQDVQVVTGRRGQMTQGRRTAPVEQLTCHDCLVSAIQCKNVGWNGKDVEWRCEALDMPNGYDLDTVVVGCEGYDYPDDPYILQGSCGIEYTVKRRVTTPSPPPPLSNSVVKKPKDKFDWEELLPVFALGICTIFVVACCYCANQEEDHQRRIRRRREAARPVPSAPPQYEDEPRRRRRRGTRVVEDPIYYPPPSPPSPPSRQSVRNAYNAGYEDASFDNYVWGSRPTPAPAVVVVEKKRSPSPPRQREPSPPPPPQETHTSVAFGTTRRR